MRSKIRGQYRTLLFSVAAGCLSIAPSCKKHNGHLLPPPQPDGAPVTVVLHPDQPGASISTTFTGFSYEVGVLPDSTFLSPSNTTMIQLIRNLGSGWLRIGGNSSDRLVWTGLPRNAGTGKDSLASSDIDRMAAFAKIVGWPVLFGLNLGVYDSARAAAEASYVNNQLGAGLAAYQIGNEPDLFSRNGHRNSTYQYSNYQQEWEQYFRSVRTILPASPFAGPDVAYKTQWITAFAPAEHANIRLLDGHYYRTGPASDTSISYHTILTPDAHLPAYLDALNNSAQPYGLGYRISECNSVYGGGKKGVSDVFASALWTLDFMWTAVQHNCQGVNFHGGPGGAYTPIAMVNGAPVARPEYYALLAFHAGAKGSLVPADANIGELNASVYSCKDAYTEYITLINKEDQQGIAFTIQPGMKAASAQVLPLKASAMTATDGVTFAGSQPDASGRFNPGQGTTYGPANGNFIVNVPAGSAAVVIVR